MMGENCGETNQEAREARGGRRLTLEPYASEEDEGTDSNEEYHRREEVEVGSPSCLERRGQDSRPGCWRQTWTWP